MPQFGFVYPNGEISIKAFDKPEQREAAIREVAASTGNSASEYKLVTIIPVRSRLPEKPVVKVVKPVNQFGLMEVRKRLPRYNLEMRSSYGRSTTKTHVRYKYEFRGSKEAESDEISIVRNVTHLAMRLIRGVKGASFKLGDFRDAKFWWFRKIELLVFVPYTPGQNEDLKRRQKLSREFRGIIQKETRKSPNVYAEGRIKNGVQVFIAKSLNKKMLNRVAMTPSMQNFITANSLNWVVKAGKKIYDYGLRRNVRLHTLILSPIPEA